MSIPPEDWLTKPDRIEQLRKLTRDIWETTKAPRDYWRSFEYAAKQAGLTPAQLAQQLRSIADFSDDAASVLNGLGRGRVMEFIRNNVSAEQFEILRQSVRVGVAGAGAAGAVGGGVGAAAGAASEAGGVATAAKTTGGFIGIRILIGLVAGAILGTVIYVALTRGGRDSSSTQIDPATESPDALEACIDGKIPLSGSASWYTRGLGGGETAYFVRGNYICSGSGYWEITGDSLFVYECSDKLQSCELKTRHKITKRETSGNTETLYYNDGENWVVIASTQGRPGLDWPESGNGTTGD